MINDINLAINPIREKDFKKIKKIFIENQFKLG